MYRLDTKGLLWGVRSHGIANVEGCEAEVSAKPRRDRPRKAEGRSATATLPIGFISDLGGFVLVESLKRWGDHRFQGGFYLERAALRLQRGRFGW